MPVTSIPRAFGGTIIFVTSSISSQNVQVIMTFRDGNTQAQYRDGKAQATFRDGVVQIGAR